MAVESTVKNKPFTFGMTVKKSDLPILVANKAGVIYMLYRHHEQDHHDYEADAFVLYAPPNAPYKVGDHVHSLNLEYCNPLSKEEKLILSNV